MRSQRHAKSRRGQQKPGERRPLRLWVAGVAAAATMVAVVGGAMAVRTSSTGIEPRADVKPASLAGSDIEQSGVPAADTREQPGGSSAGGSEVTANSTSPDYTTDLLTTKIQAYATTGHLTPLLVLPPRTMRAGERILLTSRLAAKSNAVRMPRMAIRVDAVGADHVLRSPIKAINHDGKAYGTEYVAVRWLFIAPVAGTYTITARAEASTVVEPIEATQLTVAPDLTYLKVSKVGQTSVTWGDDNTSCVGAQAIPNPHIPQCKTARSWTDVLSQVVQKGAATKAVVIGDVELSREYGSYPGGTSKLNVTLQATPTGSDGKPCAAKATKTYPVTITSTKHHWAQMTDLPVTVSCGPKLWVKVTITYVSGNPVGVESKLESNGIALLS